MLKRKSEKNLLPSGLDKETLSTLAKMYETSSEEVKFFYSESINEYFIGQQKGDLFYAGYVVGIGWVWHYSIDTPWGEERPNKPGFYYPSIPVEVEFETWLKGVTLQINKQCCEVVEENLTEIQQTLIGLDLESILKEELVDLFVEKLDGLNFSLKELYGLK